MRLHDYTKEQLDVWAPKSPDLDIWPKTLSNNYTLVAIEPKKSKIVGFVDMEKIAYLNRIYVHKDFQNRGIAKLLLLAIEKQANELGLTRLFSDVSITAKSAMEKIRYVTDRQKTRDKEGASFIQFVMHKDL